MPNSFSVDRKVSEFVSRQFRGLGFRESARVSSSEVKPSFSCRRHLQADYLVPILIKIWVQKQVVLDGMANVEKLDTGRVSTGFGICKLDNKMVTSVNSSMMPWGLWYTYLKTQRHTPTQPAIFFFR